MHHNLLRLRSDQPLHILSLIHIFAGTWMVDEGQIIIDGIDVTKLSEHKRAAYLGRVFQDPMTGTAATMGIEENLALAKRRGKTRFRCV